jgi:chromosome segregation ATPase
MADGKKQSNKRSKTKTPWQKCFSQLSKIMSKMGQMTNHSSKSVEDRQDELDRRQEALDTQQEEFNTQLCAFGKKLADQEDLKNGLDSVKTENERLTQKHKTLMKKMQSLSAELDKKSNKRQGKRSDSGAKKHTVTRPTTKPAADNGSGAAAGGTAVAAFDLNSLQRLSRENKTVNTEMLEAMKSDSNLGSGSTTHRQQTPGMRKFVTVKVEYPPKLEAAPSQDFTDLTQSDEDVNDDLFPDIAPKPSRS